MKAINLSIFPNFFKSSSAGGILLLIAVFISLLIANSPFSGAFAELLKLELGFETEAIHLKYPVLLWVNDGLMAIFFLFVGLEIKREVVEGELSTFKKAALPVFAAFGGALIPAFIYFIFNGNSPSTANGWGIPMATDIAFALGILSLLGNSVPIGLKIFLAALAIVDDLMAILVIAIFYSGELSFLNLSIALAIFILMLVLNRIGVKNIFAYILPGILMWYFIHHSGIHATIAGVLTAMTLPTNATSKISPLEKLEHFLTKPVAFVIMPIFALANTNITFENEMLQGLTSNLGYGIILGLFVGKPVGIFLLSFISVKTKIAELPKNVKWRDIFGLGILGGIGFTMSIFIALLSFDSEVLQAEAKFAILVASLLSGSVGFAVLRKFSKRKPQEVV